MKKLALGTALWGWGLDDRTCYDLLDLFYENGGRYIDTASNYPINGIQEKRYASENIISKWIKSNIISDLCIISKIGSINNKHKPENNLSTEFIKNEFDRINTKFFNNSGILMIHWDNRNDINEITSSIFQLSKCTPYKIGFSGIKFPNLYRDVLNRINYDKEFYLEIKSNIKESHIDHYKSLIGKKTRIFTYGISVSGLKLDIDQYNKNSYVRMARDKSFHDYMMTEELKNKIKVFRKNYCRVKSMYHIGIIFSELNNDIYGYIIAPRNTEQLNDIFSYRSNLINI